MNFVNDTLGFVCVYVCFVSKWKKTANITLLHSLFILYSPLTFWTIWGCHTPLVLTRWIFIQCVEKHTHASLKHDFPATGDQPCRAMELVSELRYQVLFFESSHFMKINVFGKGFSNIFDLWHVSSLGTHSKTTTNKEWTKTRNISAHLALVVSSSDGNRQEQILWTAYFYR